MTNENLEEMALKQERADKTKTVLSELFRELSKHFEEEILADSRICVYHEIGQLLNNSEYKNVSDRYLGVPIFIPIRRMILPANLIAANSRSKFMEPSRATNIELDKFSTSWVQLNSGIIIQKYVANDAGLDFKPYSRSEPLTAITKFKTYELED